MNMLPNGWTMAAIEDVFAILDDGRTLHQGWSPRCQREPSPSDDVWGVLKTTAIQAGEFQPEHNKRLPDHLEPRANIEVRQGDILITCAGPRARCGVACLVKSTRPRLMMSGKMYRFRVPEARVEAGYVQAYLQTAAARSAIDRMKTGGSDSGLNITHGRFRQLPMPVAPTSEQARIVIALEEQSSRLDSAFAALQRVQLKFGRIRAALLQAAVTGTLVADDSTRWPARSLPSLGTLERGKSRHRPRNDPLLYGGSYPFIQTGDVTAADHWITSFTQTYSEFGLARSRLWSKGTLCITIAANIAKTGILTFDGCFPDSVVGFIAEDGSAGTRWVELVIRSMQDRLEQLAPATAQKNINLAVLRAIEIPYPGPEYQAAVLAEYDRQLSLISSLEAAVRVALKRGSSLRLAVLASGFSGQLVPQDPTDEPASLLLEQIRIERQSSNGRLARSARVRTSA